MKIKSNELKQILRTIIKEETQALKTEINTAGGNNAEINYALKFAINGRYNSTTPLNNLMLAVNKTKQGLSAIQNPNNTVKNLINITQEYLNAVNTLRTASQTFYTKYSETLKSQGTTTTAPAQGTTTTPPAQPK